MAVSEHQERLLWRPTLARRRSLGWVARYQWQMVAADAACGVAAGLVALLGRFTASPQSPLYVITTAGLPLIWIAWVGMAGGYDPRLIGLGSEEFRRIINADVQPDRRGRDRVLRGQGGLRPRVRAHRPAGLGAADTAARYLLRKRLHRQRSAGCTCGG